MTRFSQSFPFSSYRFFFANADDNLTRHCQMQLQILTWIFQLREIHAWHLFMCTKLLLLMFVPLLFHIRIIGSFLWCHSFHQMQLWYDLLRFYFALQKSKWLESLHLLSEEHTWANYFFIQYSYFVKKITIIFNKFLLMEM